MENMIDLTPIIEAVIALAAMLITAFLIPWIKSKTTAQQQYIMEAVTRTLVYAAEQIYGAGNGEEKLEYVITQLKAKGYKADRDQVEAAVNQYFGKWLKPVTEEDKQRPSDEQ